MPADSEAFSDFIQSEMVFSPSQFVAQYNLALETVFPVVLIEGELLNFKIARGRWVYGDVADERSRLRLFGSVDRLNFDLEDGMRIRVLARPRLSNEYGFSLNIESIQPIGQGSIKKSQDLLAQKLESEGLFEPGRKRQIVKYPQRIGLLASADSAGYADFMKIMNARWPLVEVSLFDSRVQGERAPKELILGLNKLNSLSQNLDAIVIIRGGGSPEDLQAFSAENFVRAVANSRTPTVVGVGHEIDQTLSEKAADLAASTPSNAAELLFPSVQVEAQNIANIQKTLLRSVQENLVDRSENITSLQSELSRATQIFLDQKSQELSKIIDQIKSADPKNVLNLGYALVSDPSGNLLKSKQQADSVNSYQIRFYDGNILANKEKN